MKIKRLATRVVAAGMLLQAIQFSTAHADTVVIPHILEKSGRISDTQFTFDTTIFVQYKPTLGDHDFSSGLPYTKAGSGPDATLYLYLINDSTGAPYQSATHAEVCNPCSFPMGGATGIGKQNISLDSLIVSKGGFASPVFLGSVILASSTGSMGDFMVSSFVTNSKSSAFDLSFLPINASSL